MKEKHGPLRCEDLEDGTKRREGAGVQGAVERSSRNKEAA